MDSSNLLIGFLVYQGILTLGIMAYVIYLGVSFTSYRNAVAKAFNELLRQDEELAKRIQQIAGAFTLMDALFPQPAPPAPSKPVVGKKLPNPFNFAKNKNHLSVVDNPGKKDKTPVEEKHEEPKD